MKGATAGRLRRSGTCRFQSTLPMKGATGAALKDLQARRFNPRSQ